jgi:hypothetical protein
LVYTAGLGLAVLSSLFLLLAIGALGLIGVEGDPFDRLYLGVIAVGVVGALIARFRAPGMARAMFAMAAAQGGLAVLALILGKHQHPATSIPELLGLHAMFAALFIGSALLFRYAASPATGPAHA